MAQTTTALTRMVAEPNIHMTAPQLPLTNDSARTTTTHISTTVSELSTGDAIKMRDTVKSVGMPQSSKFGTPDGYEEKNIDLVIQDICTLEVTVKVNVPESPQPKLEEAQWWIGHKPE